MDLVLNELSLRHRSFDRADAIRRMESIIGVLRECARHGCSGVLRTLSGFLACTLCEGYTIRHWMNDNSVEQEKRTRFKTAVTKGPFVDEFTTPEESAGSVIYEFHFGNDAVYGLGVGYLLESPAVSLPGDARFEVDPIKINVSTLDSELRLLSEEKEVCSLTNTNQVSNRARWIRERIQKDIPDGSTAWDKHFEFFPNLIFCDSAAADLRRLSGTERYFYQVCRHLFVLNSFCLNLDQLGMAGLTEIKWSNESDSTLNNDELRRMREFIGPDGNRRLFSLHTKPTGGNIRIHFLPLLGQQRIMIGYIGPHLPY